MKKLFLLSAVVLGCWTAQAQQLPLISNYLNTAYLFNPAYSGIEGKTEISVLNRRQWTELQGAPETQFMAFNGNRDDLKFGYMAMRSMTKQISCHVLDSDLTLGM